MVIYGFLALFLVWAIFISWTLYTMRRHYYNLISQSKKQKIDEILDYLLLNDKKFSVEIEKLVKVVKEIIERSQMSLQKIGTVRYNPFERSGEQSFVIAILNDHNSGLVINFIYTRDGMRSYIKKVKLGKGEKYDLSGEELEAVNKATFVN